MTYYAMTKEKEYSSANANDVAEVCHAWLRSGRDVNLYRCHISNDKVVIDDIAVGRTIEQTRGNLTREL